MLARDPFMKRCIHDNEECDGRVEFEHALIYAGKQVVEWWSIVPVCTYHHRGKGLVKDFNQAVAFARAKQYSVPPKTLFPTFEKYFEVYFPNQSWSITYLLEKYKKQLRRLKLT